MKFRSILLQLDESEIVFPDGRRTRWQIASYRDRVTAVAVLGYLTELKRLVLIRNYRPALEDWSLEVAGGLPLEGESIEAAAKREFEEETGYLVRHLIPGPTLYSLPGVGRFPIACFVAESCQQSQQNLDRNELITPVLIEASRKGIAANKNEIVEPVSLALVDHFLVTRLK